MSKPPFTRSCLAALLVLGQILLGCPPSNPPLQPVAGVWERREVNLVAVPGGLVDVAGGLLVVRRVDLDLDTRLGRDVFGAVWDSKRKSWLFGFQSQYDGTTFLDDTGASHTIAALPPGSAIPGTYWVKLDASRIATKGGLVHEYGAGGLLIARYWASDPYPRIAHRSASVAGALRTTALEQCTSASACSPLFTLGYDGIGRLVSVDDRAGRRAEYTWDSNGRLLSARDGLDVQKGWPGFRYTYSGNLLASQTNSEGERIEYAFAGTSLVSVKQVGPGTPEHRFAYEGQDGAGRYHTRFWNPLGEERRYAYDPQGRLLEDRDLASGETTTLAWTGERVVSRTEPNGATTHFTYAGDDVATRSDPSGNVVSFTYAANGMNRQAPRQRALAAVSDSVGAIETRSYDAAGRLVRVANGEGEAIETTWANGAIASETQSGVTRTFSAYGEHGHATLVGVGDGTETRVFDAVGNHLRGPSDQPTPGGVDARTFDADRNLATLVLRPLGGTEPVETITLSYRSDGQRTQVLRGGDDHEFAYDAFGRLVEQRERSDGVWRTTRFGWNAAGRQRWAERPNGMREDLVYGPDGHLARVERRQGAVLEGTLDLAYQDGQLTEVIDSQSGAERYAYDSAGRRIATTFASGERIDTAYDARSRVVAETFTSAAGAPLTGLLYGHDLADRRVSIADPTGEVWAASHENGRLDELRYGNGLVRSFVYTPLGLLDTATTRNAAHEVVEATSFLSLPWWDSQGNSLMQLIASTTTTGTVDVTTFEEYLLAPYPTSSGEGGWVGPRIAGWSDGLSPSESFVFDARSNLLAWGDTELEYNAERNRLVGVWRNGESVGSYTYDAAGFATSRNGVPLAWNAAGRLVAHGADQLDWDGLGRLRSAVVGGAAAHFTFGGRMQADAAGNALALDLGEVVVGLGGAHRYRHLDFRGNVKFVSDDAGEVVAHYRYSPFGLDAVFGSDDDPVRFVARAEIGELMVLGARVYDPAVGRFLSPDPIFQIVNQYSYTLGNPIWFSDPDGLQGDGNGKLADGLEALGAALIAAGQSLKAMPDPKAKAAGEALIAIGAWLIALAHAMRLRASVAAFTFSSGGFGGSGPGPGGPGPTGCSPAALTAVPDLGGWLRFLLPLQLLLGLLVLRRRRTRRLTRAHAWRPA